MLLSKNLLLLPALILGLAACGDKPADAPTGINSDKAASSVPAAAGNSATDYSVDNISVEDLSIGGNSHDEVSIGTTDIGGEMVELAQGHGEMFAGAGSHLVIKLPTNDGGATVVRAWVGTSDRTKSFVGKGTYNAGHDDYDVHADAPDPLPEGVQWWIEIEKPDGTKAVGSANPILK